MTCWGLSGFLTSARVVFPPWPRETALPCLPVGEDSLEALRDCGPLAFGCDAGWLQTALLNIHLFLSLSRVTETLLGAEVLQQSNLMLVVTEEVEFRLGGGCAWWQRRSLRSQRKAEQWYKMKIICCSGEHPGPCSRAAVRYHHHHRAGCQPGPCQGGAAGKSEGAAS